MKWGLILNRKTLPRNVQVCVAISGGYNITENLVLIDGLSIASIGTFFMLALMLILDKKEIKTHIKSNTEKFTSGAAISYFFYYFTPLTSYSLNYLEHRQVLVLIIEFLIWIILSAYCTYIEGVRRHSNMYE